MSLEYVGENPLYIVAAGAAALERARQMDEPRTAVAVWTRLRTALHRDTLRSRADDSLAAAPIARIEVAEPCAGIAAMPLYARAQR